jgi:hypothetical protein
MDAWVGDRGIAVALRVPGGRRQMTIELRAGAIRRATVTRWLGAVALVAMATLAGGCAVDSSPADAEQAAALTGDAGQAVSNLRDAIDARDEMDAALARQLSQIGDALTPDQQRAYARAFAALPDVQRTTTTYERSAAALDAALRAIVSSPQKLASVGHPAIYQGWAYMPATDGGLYDAFKLLAQTRYAATSLRFAAHVLGGDPAYAMVTASHKQVVKDLVLPALPLAFASALVAKGSSVSALADLKDMLDAAHGKAEQAVKWIERYRTFTGAYETNPDLVKIEDQPVGKALHAVGAVLAIWEVGDGVTALTRGNAEEALRHFVKGGPDSVSAVAEATSAYRHIVLGVDKTPLAEGVVKVAGKVGAALGVVASVINTLGDLQKWNASDDAKVRVLGDLVGVGAGLLALVGAGPAGLAVGGIGLGIGLFADFLRDQRISTQDRDQKRACMPMVFPRDPGLAHTIAAADPLVIRTLSDMWMRGVDIQRVASLDPDAFTNEMRRPMPIQWVGLEVTREIFTLTGAEMATLLERVAGSETDANRRAYKVDFFLRYIGMAADYTGDMTVASGVSWLHAQASTYLVDGRNGSLDPATWKAMLDAAATYVQSVQYEGPH